MCRRKERNVVNLFCKIGGTNKKKGFCMKEALHVIFFAAVHSISYTVSQVHCTYAHFMLAKG